MTENREEYRSVLKNVLPNATDEQIELLLDIREGSQRNLRTGDNVVHYFYHGNTIPESEIEALRTELETAGLQLSYQNRNTIIKNSVQTTFEAIITFVISAQVAQSVFNGVVWETLKFFILKAWTGTANANFHNVTPLGTTKIPAITTINAPLSNNRTIIYCIRPHIPKKKVQKALDAMPKTIELHGSQLPPSEKRVLKYYYLSKKGNWKTKETNEEVIAKMTKVKA